MPQEKRKAHTTEHGQEHGGKRRGFMSQEEYDNILNCCIHTATCDCCNDDTRKKTSSCKHHHSLNVLFAGSANKPMRKQIRGGDYKAVRQGDHHVLYHRPKATGTKRKHDTAYKQVIATEAAEEHVRQWHLDHQHAAP